MDSSIAAYLPIIFIGFIVLLIIFFMPKIMGNKAESSKGSKNTLADLCARLGLTPQGNGAQGQYKGYHVSFQMSLSTNMPLMMDALSSGKMGKMYGRQTVNPALNVTITADVQFPPLALYQSMSWWRINQKIQDYITSREPDLPKMDIESEIKKIDLYGNDETTALKIVKDSEVQRLLEDWIYPDIRLEGNQVRLRLDNNNLLNEMGNKLNNTAYIEQAIEICVAIANAAK